MAEKTSSLKLTKPLETELYDVNVFNDNADKIEAAYVSMTGHIDYMQNTLNSQQQILTGSPDVTDARSGSFDFSSRGVRRAAVIYDSATTFTDAPDLPESGMFTFEMRYTDTADDSASRYTQTVYCFDSGEIFKRDGTQSAWNGWHKVAYSSEIENAFLTSLPSSILPSGANADDYTTDGQYTTTNLDLTTLTNFAQNTYGFEFFVMHTVSANRGIQVMITSQGDVYIRAFNSANKNGAFNNMNWKKLTSEAVT